MSGVPMSANPRRGSGWAIRFLAVEAATSLNLGPLVARVCLVSNTQRPKSVAREVR